VSIPGGGAPRTGGGAVVECPEATRLDIENRRSAGATAPRIKTTERLRESDLSGGFPSSNSWCRPTPSQARVRANAAT